MRSNRIGSTTGIIVVALVVIFALGAIWYFTSDVFRTKVNSAADQYTHWTPENIAKDPVNYLNFCEEQTNQAIEQLKADTISVAQSRGQLVSMKDDATAKIDTADKALPELKALWEQNGAEATTATAASSWPVTWRGNSYDRDAFKRQMVSLYRDEQTQKNLLAKVVAGISTLDNQSNKIADAQANAQAELSEIKANRELLKVQNLTDDLTKKLVDMKSALQATVATANESNKTVSLEQLTAQSAAAAPSDADFNNVLSKVK